MEASIKKNISIIPAKPAYDRSIRPQMRTLRVAAYCRVSTLMEQQESSYEAQVQYYTEKIKSNPNWKLAGIYADSLSKTLDCTVCITDTDQVIAAAGNGKKELQEMLLSAELAEVLTMDFMLLAKAKGFTYRQAITRHALRNSCVPLASTFLYLFLGVLSSSLVIEQIFGVPGLSKTLLASINGKDHWLTMGIVIFYVFIGLFMAILADLSYGIVDPRIRMGGKKND